MHFKVAPRILDHFGIAMYNTVPKAIAELCANSYDADAATVWITFAEDRIVVRDDGTGMTPKQVEDDYLYLGRDRRDGGRAGRDTTDGGRPVIGNKGIGKLAGFGIAETMSLRTWRGGRETVVNLSRRDLDMVGDLGDLELDVKSKRSGIRGSGAEIVLRDFLEETPSVDEGRLRAYLARHLPSRAGWSIHLNGTECTPEDIPGAKHLIDDEIKGFGRVQGYYIVANDRRGLTPGFSVRVRDRVVAEPSLFGLSQQTHGFFNVVRIVGELRPDFIDPVGRLQTRREQFVINTARSGFNPEDAAVQALERYAETKLRAIASGLASQRKNQRKRAALKRHPEFEGRLKALGPEIYDRLDKVLDDLIGKLSRNEDNETVDQVVDLIIRYYESDTLRIILETVREAAPAEVARLSQLLARYGAAHVSEAAHILHTQIEVIDLLRQKVSEKVLEAEIHAIITNNVWLIRPALSYWFDNKQFSTVLGERLSENFTFAGTHRPDLACFDDRRLQNRQGLSPQKLVVVEFKRPGVQISSDELQQVMRYKSVFKASLGDIPLSGIEIIVIGDSFDSTFDREALVSDYKILSYEELLANAHDRYSELFESLAPDGLPPEPSSKTSAKKTSAKKTSAKKATAKKATAKKTSAKKATAKKATAKKTTAKKATAKKTTAKGP